MCERAAEEQIQRLQCQLRETEEQLQKAAQAGLGLLDQQTELQEKLDEQRIEMTKALEVREQENYSLQKDVELKSRMLESLKSEFESVTNQQKVQLQEQEEILERKHNVILTELNNKIHRLQSALEESQLTEKQLKHKLEIQTETLNNKLEELRTLNDQAHTSMTSELMETKIIDLEDDKVALEQALQELQYKEQHLELNNRNLQRQLERVSEEKEEREKEAVSCFNALEKSREANRDLQVQLDQVLQQAQDPNSKGNSLFAELEDKRAEMEKQLIGVKVQYQSLQKQYAFTKSQMQRLKVQIATLMQMQASRADPAQLERLQSMVSEKNGEIQNLMSKLQRLERVEMKVKAQAANAAPEENADSQDTTYYTDLLKMKLNNSIKDAERLGDELSLQRMKSFSESQRALELERKLFTAERLLKQAQSDKITLQLRSEELQQKYEPKEANKNPLQKRKKEKLVFAPSGVKLEESEQPIQVMTAVKHSDINTAEEIDTKQDAEIEERPRKSVKISAEQPDVIPNPSSCLSECNVKTENQERRKKQKVEVIYVKPGNPMGDQCAQQ